MVKNNTLDYLKQLENAKSQSSEQKESQIQLDFSSSYSQKNPEIQEIQNVKNVEKIDTTNQENNRNTNVESLSEEETQSVKFNDLVGKFYKSEYSKFFASLSSKGTEKFYLSEISDCLLKIVYSKHLDEIKNRFGNLFNNDNIYYLLNLHSIKGTKTHEYIQNWFKNNNINCELEKRLELKIEDITLVGRCDIVVYDDIPYIVELKSSSSHNSYHELQVQLQMYLINKINPPELNNKKIETSYLWYYFQQKYYTIKYDEQYVNNFINYLKILKSVLNTTLTLEQLVSTYGTYLKKLASNNQNMCSSCIYKNVCEFFVLRK